MAAVLGKLWTDVILTDGQDRTEQLRDILFFFLFFFDRDSLRLPTAGLDSTRRGFKCQCVNEGEAWLNLNLNITITIVNGNGVQRCQMERSKLEVMAPWSFS
ncbi:hypothetical protein HRR80_007568 [Exophiala dermatitidis]|uniref:Uncharacterized protein n=1 Tax=Exophiala dermatitidis TaxID=5970 RepID=A0AAN6IS42_EXODE|nr:hypothetical protein HRR86_007317 [Exophiala dermatitidis]KAJ8988545.1 hypothetical protein HRR80_007568 [Exophiala dermatitidis]